MELYARTGFDFEGKADQPSEVARLAMGAARVRAVPQTFWGDVVRP